VSFGSGVVARISTMSRLARRLDLHRACHLTGGDAVAQSARGALRHDGQLEQGLVGCGLALGSTKSLPLFATASTSFWKRMLAVVEYRFS
jgi:hypothetical protein